MTEDGGRLRDDQTLKIRKRFSHHEDVSSNQLQLIANLDTSMACGSKRTAPPLNAPGSTCLSSF